MLLCFISVTFPVIYFHPLVVFCRRRCSSSVETFPSSISSPCYCVLFLLLFLSFISIHWLCFAADVDHHQWKPFLPQLAHHATVFYFCDFSCHLFPSTGCVLPQTLIIISGNLSFLNWLTMLPCIACFDDASLSWLFARTTKLDVYKLQQETKADVQPRPAWSKYGVVFTCHAIMIIIIIIFIIYKVQ